MSDTPRKVFVTGTGGQLGSEINNLSEQHPEYHFVFFHHNELDITDLDSVRKLINPSSNDIIINAAAYTAVDLAEEDEPKVRGVNTIGPMNLAQVAADSGCLLIHISTDYVFNGELSRPYKEDDPTGPLNVYGATKLEGENAVLQSGARALIIRTSWLYSTFGNNFVKTMLRLGKAQDNISVVFEQSGTPTYARDLAVTIFNIIKQLPSSMRLPQIYHYSNEGVISWYDFAQSIMELADLSCNVTPIEIKDYPLPAERPVYSVLNKSKIKHDFGITIPYWRDSLRDCLEMILEDHSQ